MTDFGALLTALNKAGVEFLVVGGAAATAHGSSRLTVDLDLVYRRTPDNLKRVVKALVCFSRARARGAKLRFFQTLGFLPGEHHPRDHGQVPQHRDHP